MHVVRFGGMMSDIEAKLSESVQRSDKMEGDDRDSRKEVGPTDVSLYP